VSISVQSSRADGSRSAPPWLPELGGFVSMSNTPMLDARLPEHVKKMEVTGEGIRLMSSIVLPYAPFIGTLGVSREIEVIARCSPSTTAANPDVRDLASTAAPDPLTEDP